MSLPAPIQVERHRVVVVGAGVAGLSAALAVGDATVVVDGLLGGGSSPWAQGGLAAAVGQGDSPADHARDTLAVAAGLGAAEAVEVLTGDAPAAVTWLREVGAQFDVDARGRLTLSREAGHRARRVVRAHGDATGAEIMRALCAATRARGLAVRQGAVAVDLLRRDGRVVGVLARQDGRLVAHLAGAVVLATGGYGHLWARTTNPPQVAGAGVAMAARAGARLADLEMVQFHPTALAVPGVDPLPLLTEALRGEGAILVNELGQRYLAGEHPDAELAPRDVVARANYRQLQAGHTPLLDARAAVGEAFPQRFPTVFALAAAHGLDPRTDLLPVSPAAHYCMGGVATDAAGRTSLPGLWAIGECASTGAHGANRLASNSMLEGVVMGRRIARAVGQARFEPGSHAEVDRGALRLAHDPDDVPAPDDALAQVREILWQSAGVVRDADGLAAGSAQIAALTPDAAAGARSRDAVAVAALVLAAAARRRESRGAHFRSDYPLADPTRARRGLWDPAPGPTTTLTFSGRHAEVPEAVLS